MSNYTSTNTAGTEIRLGGNLVKPTKIDVNNIKQVSNFMVDILKRSRRLTRHELEDWQQGRTARYRANNPSTYLLTQVFQDAMLDLHLTAVTENRTLRTINKEFVLVDSEGIIDKERSKYLSKKWFYDLTKYAHESIYHGYSLVFIQEVEKANIKKIKLVEHEYINPALGILLKQVTDTTGLDYSLFPNQLLFAQLTDGIGLLEKAAPYTILKRHSWSSWDEFEELFGIPIRIAKIASNSDEVKKEVAGWLEEMGSAAYGVFPTGTEVEIKENSKSDAFNVFFQKIKVINEELSKLVVHQTMTTENGSSKSQGQVHEQTLNEVIQADEKNILSWLDDVLLPVMRFYGYDIPEDYSFSVRTVINPEKRIIIDEKLMKNGVVLKQSYLEEIYGVEIESMPIQNKEVKDKLPVKKKP